MQVIVQSIADRFLATLRRMAPEERHIVFTLFLGGCPAILPDNIHIHADLLRRSTDQSIPRLKRTLGGGVNSLGSACALRQDMEEEAHVHGEVLSESPFFELTWNDLSADHNEDVPGLCVAAMIEGVTENYCEVHSMQFLERLDFSRLSHATAPRATQA